MVHKESFFIYEDITRFTMAYFTFSQENKWENMFHEVLSIVGWELIAWSDNWIEIKWFTSWDVNIISIFSSMFPARKQEVEVLTLRYYNFPSNGMQESLASSRLNAIECQVNFCLTGPSLWHKVLNMIVTKISLLHGCVKWLTNFIVLYLFLISFYRAEFFPF